MWLVRLRMRVPRPLARAMKRFSDGPSSTMMVLTRSSSTSASVRASSGAVGAWSSRAAATAVSSPAAVSSRSSSSGLASWTYVADASDPLRAEVILEPLAPTEGNPLMTTVRFYGGAAEAAGSDALEIDAAKTPATLGALLDGLSASHPGLAPVLAVSSFLVDQRPADRERALSAGARIDVLPPFAGG